MKLSLPLSLQPQNTDSIVWLADKSALATLAIPEDHKHIIEQQWAAAKHLVSIPEKGRISYYLQIPDKAEDHIHHEKLRKLGYRLSQVVNEDKIQHIQLYATGPEDLLFPLLEGLLLSNYQFLKYKTGDAKQTNSLNSIVVAIDKLKEKKLRELENLVKAVNRARDLVNEPVIFLTAEQLSEEFRAMGLEAGFHVEILNKAKIQHLKMGGLLAVNAGAPNPPTFSILEYKSPQAVNTNPIVLVGKGVVFDTGGLSLKPTEKSMDFMKADMAGAAAAACALYAAALNKLPLHLVALIPATENRPDGNAITPGDVITTMHGKTVEILNTDAEGRLILADALAYASRYKPELVIDLATLTGAAARAIGKEGIVYMSTADTKVKNELEQAGRDVYERLVEFPLWDEYDDYLKSDIADITNLGPAEAGAITAGKFLQHFVSYPWAHMDIAGTAYCFSQDHYRGKNGTGSGVRLLYRYLSKRG